ncbi:MAG: UvrD-helicase domain-containing protein [Clostridia bacterium]
MSISDRDRISEENRLNVVYEKLESRIDDLDASLNDNIQKLKNSNIEMWDQGKRDLVDFGDAIENMPYLDMIKTNTANVESIKREVNRMMLLKRDLYFGRIDFKEETEPESENIYIGKCSFIDNNGEYLVYDWRANICSLFYENEIGDVSYEAPVGIISGSMSKKRQYEIFYNKIVSMFDSSIKIDDSILKEILSHSKDSKMGNIVETIQKEQNQAIRSTSNIIIVEGPAGCGKTSIALHRAAWLMYKYKNELNHNQIIIFSPNETFIDYVSEVLPELGEENVAMSTFYLLSKDILAQKYVLLTGYREMEDLLQNNEYIDKNDIKTKYSVAFAKKLEVFAQNIANSGYEFNDLVINDNVIMSKNEYEQLFFHEYSFNDVITRLSKIKNIMISRVLTIIRALRVEYVRQVRSDEIDMSRGYVMLKEKCRRIYDMVDEAVTTDFELLYSLFLERYYSREMKDRYMSRLSNGYINYEDIAPLIYLRFLLGFKKSYNDIRYVIVDEFQDYSYIEKKVISIIFRNCHMTLLGDLNQKIKYCLESSDDTRIFKKADQIKLNKSYRSTYQIAKFCNDLLPVKADIKYVNRQGSEPYIIKTGTDDIEVIAKHITDRYHELKNKGYCSIAVLTRSDTTVKKLYAYLKDIKISNVSEKNTSYTMGTVLMPSYLSKGLEFDAVIVLDIENDKFNMDEELNLFYTCCTRALHDLTIIR